jgi:hypothetical protein
MPNLGFLFSLQQVHGLPDKKSRPYGLASHAAIRSPEATCVRDEPTSSAAAVPLGLQSLL